MTSSTIDLASLLAPMTALGLLPNVKPGKALALLKEAREDLITQSLGRRYGGGGKARSRCYVRLRAGGFLGWGQPGGYRLALADVEQMFVEDVYRGNETAKISFEGAATLVGMYEAGAFELKNSHRGIGDPSELMAYAQSREAIEQQMHEEAEADRKREEAFLRQIDDLPSIPPLEFTYDLLNRAFLHHVGYGGDRILKFGGIRVYRTIKYYRSNSGKSADYEISFSWTGSDGRHHRRVRKSRYKENRRNDPDRNWGLPPRG